MAEDGFVDVRYVGGSYDGRVGMLSAELAREGYELPHLLRHHSAVPEATRPLMPTIIPPDASWERYVLRGDADGWVFEYVP